MVTLKIESNQFEEKKIEFECYEETLNVLIRDENIVKWVNLGKDDAKQIISFLQNHFNL